MNAPPPNQWSLAIDHCWKHVNTASTVAELLKRLVDVPVESVVPIISTIGPALLVTPLHHDSVRKVRELCNVITHSLRAEQEWKPFISGNKWTLRLRLDAVSIDVVTSIEAIKSAEEWKE